MTDTTPSIKVNMFGGFSLSYEGESLNFRFGASTKTMQILELLLSYYPKGVSKSSMLQNIFEFDDILNPNNNLKVSISQLRNALSEFSLPCDEFIRYKSESYSWSCPIPLEKDTNFFEEAIALSEKAENDADRKRFLYAAVKTYKGNFLPGLVGIDWAEKQSIYYYNKYSYVITKLAAILMDEQKYEECFDLYSTAYSIHKAEEWQIGKIECLMKLAKWAKAKDVYHETVLSLEHDFGVDPSPQLLEQYRLISEKTDNAISSFENMLSSVKENKSLQGAYYCAFPGFVDSCRVLSRNMERSGISCYLMMLFLGDLNGNVIKNEARLEEGSKSLFDAIQNSLRKGDSFTQYNKSQFLVFLFGTSRENCDLVADRIIGNYKKAPARGTHIRYEVTSAVLDQLDDYKSRSF